MNVEHRDEKAGYDSGVFDFHHYLEPRPNRCKWSNGLILFTMEVKKLIKKIFKKRMMNRK